MNLMFFRRNIFKNKSKNILKKFCECGPLILNNDILISYQYRSIWCHRSVYNDQSCVHSYCIYILVQCNYTGKRTHLGIRSDHRTWPY
uniref:Uncharacterized protein n=1 Tax=Anguilla anguilla TaxID=7936 RepID=A0A0E9TUT3_ANGAN